MINKVILVGNVGIDPEVRAIESGVKVARVRLATTERIFNRQTNESTEHTEWHTVILWRGLADVVDRFVRKGSQLYIEGSLRTREWMDKENQKRYTTEIIASDMKLLGKRSDNPAGGQSAGQGGYQPQGGVQGGYAAPASQAGGYAQPAAQPCSPPPLRSFRRRRIPTICRSETVAAGDDAVFVSCTDGCRSKERHPYFYSKMRGGLQNVDHPAYRGPLLVSAALRTVAGCGRKATVRTNFVSRFNPCCGSAAAPTLPAGSVARAAPAGRSGGRSLRGVCRVPKHGTASRRPSRGA